MKRKITGALLWGALFALPAGLSAQVGTDSSSHRNFSVQTTQAHYPGGNQELYTFFFEQMEYPEEAREKKIQGDVYLSFYVEADSSVTNVQVLSDPGGLGDEAKRLIQMVKFAPALRNGRAVRQNMMLSVPFRLYESTGGQ